MNPYANPNHALWVEAGHCDAISEHKSWCMFITGHSGDHASPLITSYDGKHTLAYWERTYPRGAVQP